MILHERVLRAFIRYVPCLALWCAQVSPAQHASSSRTDWQQFPTAQDYLTRDRERLLRDLQWNERSFAPPDSFPVIGRWAWGPCYAVAAKDSFAFIGNGSLFQVLSSPDTGQPVIIAEYLTAGIVVDIAINDSLAFVVASNKLEVYDISDLPSLTLLTEFTLPFVAPTKIALRGSYAYVLFFNGQFGVVDVGHPSSPYMRGTVFATFEDARALEASGTFAYVGATDSPYLTVVNAQNPDSPFVAANIPAGTSLNLYVTDTLLFVGSFFNYFDLYSISNPSLPQLLSRTSFGTPGSNAPSGFSSRNTLAYIGSSQVYVADISDPHSPRIIDSISHPQIESSNRMSIAGSKLYNSRFVGIWSLDVSDPTVLRHRWSFTTADQCWKVTHRGNFAFVASGYAGLWILDVSDPTNIRNVANVLTGGLAADVALSGNLAFIVNYPLWPGVYDNRGLWTIDVTDPSQPVILSHHTGIVRPSGNAVPNSVAAKEGLVFIAQVDAANDTALEIVDVSSPTQPVTRSIFRTVVLPYDVAVRDTFAFLAGFGSGIHVLSFACPDSPHVVASALNHAVGLAITDSILFAVADSGLSILDISTPSTPSLLGATRLCGGTRADVSEADGFVYTAQSIVCIADARDRTRPVKITQFGLAWDPYGIAAYNDTLIVVGRGLWILRNSLLTSVELHVSQPPSEFSLSQNYPNPFNPSTTIEYQIPVRTFLRLSIYNLIGQRVLVLAEGIQAAGYYTSVLDGSNLSSGIYFVTLETDRRKVVRKMALLR